MVVEKTTFNNELQTVICMNEDETKVIFKQLEYAVRTNRYSGNNLLILLEMYYKLRNFFINNGGVK